MNQAFLRQMMNKTAFPPQAQQALLTSADALIAAGQTKTLASAVADFYSQGFSIPHIQPWIDHMAEQAALSPYTVWLLFLIEAAQTAREDFRKEGISEEIFWDTFSDLRCKALECYDIHQVWGTFVASWYPIFYSRRLVKLGRLEYETHPYYWEEPYIWRDLCVKKGDPVKSIHIPSSGEPFDQAVRLDSYRRAYDFFREELDGGPLVCICHSWLLYPPYGKLLSSTSNIASFQRDFDIIGQDSRASFDDGWRLFGPDWQQPTAALPERTSMQRAFKRHLLAGGPTGVGRGVLIFDGKRIVNQ